MERHMCQALPIMTIVFPPWSPLLEQALQANQDRPDARYVQLATRTAAGDPANRTIVFRGFWQAHQQLMFVSDQRSPKVAHIRQHPWGEACWYFPVTREQFRLTGALSVVDHHCNNPELHQYRQQTWQRLSPATRQPFTGPPPGLPLPLEPMTDQSATCIDAPPPFCLVLLAPHQVDHLQLLPSPHQRQRYQQHPTGDWFSENITP